MDKDIISYNVAAWRWRISNESYRDRLKRSCRYIKEKAPEAFVIGLQEIILGKKYLELLQEEFPAYKIVLPQGYDIDKKKRSAISVMLISTNGLQSCTERTIQGFEDIARYNYVTISTDFGCYRVLNVNIPQTAFNSQKAVWYQKERNQLKKSLMNAILFEAETYRFEKDINFILLGDMNCNFDDPFITSLADNFQQPMMEAVRKEEKGKITWRNGENKNCLDHIFYSMGMMASDAVDIHFTEIFYQTILEEMSDHAVLKGSFNTYVKDFKG